MQPRDPALRPYRVAIYVLFGILCTALFVQLIRSVVGDLYGRTPPASTRTREACLEDVSRLYDQLAARAVQPAPRGLESGALTREWDDWSRRWEDDRAEVETRCARTGTGPAANRLADALDGIEELRRRLSRSGTDAAQDARRVKEDLAAAREELRTP